MLNKFVFIIGVGRSGTTLIQSMLHSHSSIHFTPETHFVKKYLSKGSSLSANSTDLIHLIDKINNDVSLNEVSKNLSAYCDKATSDDAITNKFAWIFEQILKEKSGDAVYLGDKDPMNVNYLKLIKSTFPDSRIIHIIRDPRDVVLSRMKSAWGKKNKMASHVAEYQHGLRKARKEGVEYFGDNYTEVRYEDLISDPRSSIDKLCSFLELPFEDATLNHQKSSLELLRKDEGDWKSNVLQPVLSENSEKWKKELSASQIEKMEFALDSVLEELNYSKSTNKKGLKELIFNLFVKIYHLAYTIRFN